MTRICRPILIAILLCIAGCSSGTEDFPDPAGQAESLDSVLTALYAEPVPDNISKQLFTKLKSELAHELRSRGVQRFVCQPPTVASSASQLSWEKGTNALSWGYYSTGDYNQDSIVSINDLTPLGQKYKLAVPADPDDWLAVVNGNGDAEINISDITQIGQNFNTKVTAYNVYSSMDTADYPTSVTDDNGDATPLGTVEFDQGDVVANRRTQFSYIVDSPEVGASYWVRPTDGTAEGTPSTLAKDTVPPNQKPVAQLNADPLSGDVPLLVEFDASESYDLDGVITKYQWDWDGIEGGWIWYDSGEQSTTQHTYTEVGEYAAAVRVFDDDGDGTVAYAFVTASSTTNEPPEAVLATNPDSGNAPLTVDFNAADSVDPDGALVDYEWDLDGDGMYNGPTPTEMDAQGENNAQFTYNSAGNYTVKLRVTDNEGATGDDSTTIIVGGGTPEWHITTVAGGDYTYYPQLADVNGRPGIVFYNDTVEEIMFIHADDPLGANWTEIPDSVGGELYDWMKLVESGGNPAVLYLSTGGMTFVCAENQNGTAWGEPVVAGTPTEIVYKYGGAVIDGFPAATYYSSVGSPQGYLYHRATTTSGQAWSDPQVIQQDGLGIVDMVAVNGAPGLCYEDPDNSYSLTFRRATDATGSTWNDPVSVDPDVLVWFFPKIKIVSGFPAILYSDGGPESVTPLYFIRAADQNGASWGDRRQVDSLEFALYSPDLAVIDGRPAACYVGGPTPRTLFFKHALDTSGANWPETADTIVADAQFTETSLADIGGHPAIAFSYGSDVPEIRFAIYY